MQDTVPHTRRKVARARPTATAVCQSPCSWGNIFTGLLRGDRIIGPRQVFRLHYKSPANPCILTRYA